MTSSTQCVKLGYADQWHLSLPAKQSAGLSRTYQWHHQDSIVLQETGMLMVCSWHKQCCAPPQSNYVVFIWMQKPKYIQHGLLSSFQRDMPIQLCWHFSYSCIFNKCFFPDTDQLCRSLATQQVSVDNISSWFLLIPGVHCSSTVGIFWWQYPGFLEGIVYLEQRLEWKVKIARISLVSKKN